MIRSSSTFLPDAHALPFETLQLQEVPLVSEQVQLQADVDGKKVLVRYPFFTAALRTKAYTQTPHIHLGLGRQLMNATISGMPLVCFWEDEERETILKTISRTAECTGMEVRQINAQERSGDLLWLLHRALTHYAKIDYVDKDFKPVATAIAEEYNDATEVTIALPEPTNNQEAFENTKKLQRAQEQHIERHRRQDRLAERKTVFIVTGIEALSELEQQALLDFCGNSVALETDHLRAKDAQPMMVILQHEGQELPRTVQRATFVQYARIGATPGQQVGFTRPYMEEEGASNTASALTLQGRPGLMALNHFFFAMEHSEQGATLDVPRKKMLAKVRRFVEGHAAVDPRISTEELMQLWHDAIPDMARRPKKDPRVQQDYERAYRELWTRAKSHTLEVEATYKDLQKHYQAILPEAKFTAAHDVGVHFHDAREQAQGRHILHESWITLLRHLGKGWKHLREKDVMDFLLLFLAAGHTDVVGEGIAGANNNVSDLIRERLRELDTLAYMRSILGANINDALYYLKRQVERNMHEVHAINKADFYDEEERFNALAAQRLAELPTSIVLLTAQLVKMHGYTAEENAPAREAIMQMLFQLRHHQGPLELDMKLKKQKPPVQKDKRGQIEAAPLVLTKENLRASIGTRGAPHLEAVVSVALPRIFNVWKNIVEPVLMDQDFVGQMTPEDAKNFRDYMSYYFNARTIHAYSLVGDKSDAAETQRKAYVKEDQDVQKSITESFCTVIEFINMDRLRKDLEPLPHFPLTAALSGYLVRAEQALVALSYTDMPLDLQNLPKALEAYRATYAGDSVMQKYAPRLWPQKGGLIPLPE